LPPSISSIARPQSQHLLSLRKRRLLRFVP